MNLDKLILGKEPKQFNEIFTDLKYFPEVRLGQGRGSRIDTCGNEGFMF